MQLSEHFTLDEFTVSRTAAAHGIDNTPPPGIVVHLSQTARELEAVRELLAVPIIITSGYRCQALNDAVPGSSKTSAHTRGWAVDFIAPQFGSPIQICQQIKAAGLKFDQLIYEFTWVHISFEEPMRNEVLTKKADRPGYLAGLVE